MEWVAAAVLVSVGWLTVWVAQPKDTRRRRIRARGLRQEVRRYRTEWVRVLLWWFAWPHLVDKVINRRHQPTASEGHVVWQEGIASLTRYAGRPRAGPPVLLVHSLVSQPSILDLTPDRSLVAFLIAEGFDVFLLDWGEFGRADATRGLDDFASVLRAAEREVLARTRSKKLHEIAYCLGATLAVRDAAESPKPYLKSIALIAPMIDFHVPGGFRAVLAHRSLRPVLILDGDGLVPAGVVREAFHVLRPRAVRTVWTRLRLDKTLDDSYKEFYAGMAGWAWSQRRLPGALFFDVVDLFRTNPFVAGLGEVSPLSSIKQPILVTIAGRDHIVPSGSSHALSAIPGLSVKVVNVPSGHVSMVVGSAAKQVVWPALATWLRE